MTFKTQVYYIPYDIFMNLFISDRAFFIFFYFFLSSPFKIKWRVSISWSKLNITDLILMRSDRAFFKGWGRG
jgi:hypothetical protein